MQLNVKWQFPTGRVLKYMHDNPEIICQDSLRSVQVVYAFYSLSLLSERGVPLVRKAHVTELQMFQLLA